MLADRRKWYSDDFDCTGPACYELGTGGPSAGRIQPHYVGETSNESRRMGEYASHGGHLSEIIDYHLRQGWGLYYRAVACTSKRDAERMPNNLLRRHKYDWNIQLNGDD